MSQHRHDPVIRMALRRIDRDCKRLVIDLDDLAAALADGKGHPVPGEMTPSEVDYLATMLGAVGMTGAAIIIGDLETTADREGREDPEPMPDDLREQLEAAGFKIVTIRTAEDRPLD